MNKLNLQRAAFFGETQAVSTYRAGPANATSLIGHFHLQ